MSELEWLTAFERGVSEARDPLSRFPARIERREPINRESIVGDSVLWLYVVAHPYLDKHASQGITETHLQMGNEIAYRLGEHVARRLFEL